ncbi:hypothetical protein VNI00_015128 [Paramarasmius palmivorus]|uniref:Uncharacterized protein n=1 Tax=Paramarasmius palmivorus TaxID=297713 RepID=A0AAW0BNW4_9AGAR
MVLVGQTTQFQWTWNSLDPSVIGVGLKMAQNGGPCPGLVNDRAGLVTFSIVTLDLSIYDQPADVDRSRHGSDDFVARQTGSESLFNFSLVASSDIITANLVSPRSGVNTGEIIGISIGSFAACFILVACLLSLRSYRRRGVRNECRGDITEDFIIKVVHRVPQGNAHLVPSTSPAPQQTEQPTNSNSTTDVTNQAHQNQEHAFEPREQRARRIVEHGDSGWRPSRQPSQTNSSVLDIPPGYEAAV